MWGYFTVVLIGKVLYSDSTRKLSTIIPKAFFLHFCFLLSFFINSFLMRWSPVTKQSAAGRWQTTRGLECAKCCRGWVPILWLISLVRTCDNIMMLKDNMCKNVITWTYLNKTHKWQFSWLLSSCYCASIVPFLKSDLVSWFAGMAPHMVAEWAN